jgi:hypothetical protein
MIVQKRKTVLPQMILAARPPRGLARSLHGRQQERDQHTNNRDHDQQLDERHCVTIG